MIVLDTCTLLWLARGDRLPPMVAAFIADEANGLFVSAVSAWEIALKVRKGRLELPMPTHHWWDVVLSHHGIAEVPIEASIAIRSAELPPLHADPADRIVIATTQHLRGKLLTPDPLITAYPNVDVIWA